jgi:hypothetical protein
MFFSFTFTVNKVSTENEELLENLINEVEWEWKPPGENT